MLRASLGYVVSTSLFSRSMRSWCMQGDLSKVEGGFSSFFPTFPPYHKLVRYGAMYSMRAEDRERFCLDCLWTFSISMLLTARKTSRLHKAKTSEAGNYKRNHAMPQHNLMDQAPILEDLNIRIPTTLASLLGS